MPESGTSENQPFVLKESLCLHLLSSFFILAAAFSHNRFFYRQNFFCVAYCSLISATLGVSVHRPPPLLLTAHMGPFRDHLENITGQRSVAQSLLFMSFFHSKDKDPR